MALGFSEKAIRHRVKSGRLHRIWPGVYSVGRSELSREGRWRIEVGVRHTHLAGPQALRVRRRPSLPSQDVGTLDRIPITSPVRTMIDLARELPTKLLTRAVNEADKLEVIDVETLRGALDSRVGIPGVKRLVALLDKDTFVLTEEELERLFLPLAREVGLPLPKTKEIVNGYEVDFFWPELKLVVETDGLRYHRTPSAQAKDARRDQAHTAAGYARLRFTHWQVKYERGNVKEILGETAARLSRVHTRVGM